MSKKNKWWNVILVGLLVAALGVCLGCSSEDKAEVETAAESTGKTVDDAAKTASDVIDKAKDLKVAVANPDPKKDPVCGMAVTYDLIETIDGKPYAFCSKACAKKFADDPEKYLAAATKDPHEGHNH
jgi:YHS domain-containing protein